VRTVKQAQEDDAGGKGNTGTSTNTLLYRESERAPLLVDNAARLDQVYVGPLRMELKSLTYDVKSLGQALGLRAECIPVVNELPDEVLDPFPVYHSFFHDRAAASRDMGFNTDVATRYGVFVDSGEETELSVALAALNAVPTLELCKDPQDPQSENVWMDYSCPSSSSSGDSKRTYRAYWDGWGGDTNNPFLLTPVSGPDVKSHDGSVLLYHATTHASACNIVVNGIDLPRGDEKLDFSISRSFSLNPDFEDAQFWAAKKALRDHVPVAIVAFNVNSSDLKAITPNFTFTGPTPLWRDYIRCCRLNLRRDMRQQPLLKPYESWQWVFGGQCANPGKLSVEQARPRSDCGQYCIRMGEAVDYLDEHVHGVVFYSLSSVSEVNLLLSAECLCRS